MKLLKIRAKNLPLMRGDLEIDFLAQQRVGEEDKDTLYHLFSNVYTNSVVAFIGLNASGKTTVLKVISFVLNMLNNRPVNEIEANELLGQLAPGEKVTFEAYFYCENGSGTINRLETEIEKRINDLDGSCKYIIADEVLWSKEIKAVKTKKSIYDFGNVKKQVLQRKADEEYLMEDVSIMIAFNKKNTVSWDFRDMSRFTDFNLLRLIGKFPPELIAFLDPSIEYLKFRKIGQELEIQLKFRGKKELALNNPVELNNYLSSGTIKGLNVFMNAFFSFRDGGYLLIDELENHFNQEIVATLIRFFLNRRVNKEGATLIFSTHYAELLDEFDRNDNIYIVRNQNGIAAENLAQILERNDMKKSDAYQSGFLKGTTPSYETYINLKNVM